ncbi:hypothetical protein AAE478_010434 [Parahypoxylon ruwenzoriense]
MAAWYTIYDSSVSSAASASCPPSPSNAGCRQTVVTLRRSEGSTRNELDWDVVAYSTYSGNAAADSSSGGSGGRDAVMIDHVDAWRRGVMDAEHQDDGSVVNKQQPSTPKTPRNDRAFNITHSAPSLTSGSTNSSGAHSPPTPPQRLATPAEGPLRSTLSGSTAITAASLSGSSSGSEDTQLTFDPTIWAPHAPQFFQPPGLQQGVTVVRQHAPPTFDGLEYNTGRPNKSHARALPKPGVRTPPGFPSRRDTKYDGNFGYDFGYNDYSHHGLGNYTGRTSVRTPPGFPSRRDPKYYSGPHGGNEQYDDGDGDTDNEDILTASTTAVLMLQMRLQQQLGYHDDSNVDVREWDQDSESESQYKSKPREQEQKKQGPALVCPRPYYPLSARNPCFSLWMNSSDDDSEAGWSMSA